MFYNLFKNANKTELTNIIKGASQFLKQPKHRARAATSNQNPNYSGVRVFDEIPEK
ncbi:MAG: hypothetical protein QNJ63_02870 [Calothrix sp. MO_192.B10]|nr:hypothetical protein [Calothrix sp. MO_192.B10]